MIAVYHGGSVRDAGVAEDHASKALELYEQSRMQLERAKIIAKDLARFLEEAEPEV